MLYVLISDLYATLSLPSFRRNQTWLNQRMFFYQLPCLSSSTYISFPILFYKPLSSIIGPSAPIVIPRVAQPPQEHIPDYEVELVIVIGKTAKNVPEADALDYVLAYTGANDVRMPDKSIVYYLTNPLSGIVPKAPIGSLPVEFLQRIW